MTRSLGDVYFTGLGPDAVGVYLFARLLTGNGQTYRVVRSRGRDGARAWATIYPKAAGDGGDVAAAWRVMASIETRALRQGLRPAVVPAWAIPLLIGSVPLVLAHGEHVWRRPPFPTVIPAPPSSLSSRYFHLAAGLGHRAWCRIPARGSPEFVAWTAQRREPVDLALNASFASLLPEQAPYLADTIIDGYIVDDPAFDGVTGSLSRTHYLVVDCLRLTGRDLADLSYGERRAAAELVFDELSYNRPDLWLLAPAAPTLAALGSAPARFGHSLRAMDMVLADDDWRLIA